MLSPKEQCNQGSGARRSENLQTRIFGFSAAGSAESHVTKS